MALVGCNKLPKPVDVNSGAVAGDDMKKNEMVAKDDGDLDNGDPSLVADVTIDVEGVNYSFSKTSIEVNEGDVVRINFQSKGGFHDWVVDEFNAHTDQVNPGTLTSVTFIADKAGTFEYYCSVGQHRAHGMVGKLIVKAKDAGDDMAGDEEANEGADEAAGEGDMMNDDKDNAEDVS